MGYSGSAYTWVKSSTVAQPLKQRLDRALANIDWKLLFPDGFVRHLPRVFSDHAPVLVSLAFSQTLSPDHMPFLFQAMWFTNPACDEIVNRSWASQGGELLHKLKVVVADVRC